MSAKRSLVGAFRGRAPPVDEGGKRGKADPGSRFFSLFFGVRVDPSPPFISSSSHLTTQTHTPSVNKQQNHSQCMSHPLTQKTPHQSPPELTHALVHVPLPGVVLLQELRVPPVCVCVFYVRVCVLCVCCMCVHVRVYVLFVLGMMRRSRGREAYAWKIVWKRTHSFHLLLLLADVSPGLFQAPAPGGGRGYEAHSQEKR